MSFSVDISKFVEKANGNVDLVVRKVTIDVAQSVVLKSPVGNPDVWLSLNPYVDLGADKLVRKKAPAGYVGGRFRANWLFGVGAVNRSTINSIDKSGQTTIARLIAGIGHTGAGGVTYVSNNLPYAIPLEYGHSGQAPQGMLRITAMEFQSYVTKAAREVR